MIALKLLQIQSTDKLIGYLVYNVLVIKTKLNGLHRMGLYGYNEYGGSSGLDVTRA